MPRTNLSQNNVLVAAHMLVNESPYMTAPEPQPYQPEKKYFSMSKYDTPEELFKGIKKSGDPIAKCLSGMSTLMRNNEQYMLQVIGTYPEAYQYAGSKLRSDEFLQKALHQNPYVYDVISAKDRKRPEIMQAYIEGLQTGGSELPTT